MRAAVCPAMTLVGILAGCSPLLGIEDPKPRTDAGDLDAPAVDASDIDAALIDAPAGDFLTLSVGEFKLARQQVVRLRVQRMLTSGGMEDVTDTATYSADNGAVTFGAKGTVQGVQAGLSTITVSLSGATPVMVKATVSTFTCHPVINEFTTGTEAAMGGDDEFIEIYNPCINTIDVTDWTLNYRAASAIAADTNLLVTLTGSLSPGDLRVYGGSAYMGTSVAKWMTNLGMQRNNGSIALRDGPFSTGILVDSVAYGNAVPGNPLIETRAMPAMAHGMSGSRLPFDGKDDAPEGTADGDNAADFQIVPTPTPGALNAP